MAPLPKSVNHHPPTPTPMNYFPDTGYPHELSSFLHGHKLTHMIRNPLIPSRTHRVCDVCRESIHDNFYHCKDCHFHVHSYCTRLPNNLRHIIDPDHKLCLYKLSYGHCSICKEDCSSLWVYGCTVCEVNIHLNCLRKSTVQQTSGSRGMHHHYAPPPWGTWPPPQQQFHGWGYPNPYNNNHHGNSPSSSFGSLFGSTMFSLVESLGIGALTDFIFGSISF
ncbi:uncharacterized protein LOC101203241 [Cucumis sativus]|uniref:DC1 domain-containing protein n=1 Tax=Cucumis sativus TaxID=3659 RepID=A0A0A0L116_CUCSA|nr:uncharacterized protein LOC101203241 [Cucumis sativus]